MVLWVENLPLDWMDLLEGLEADLVDLWEGLTADLGDYMALNLVDLVEYQVIDLVGWVNVMGLVLLADLQGLLLSFLVLMEEYPSLDFVLEGFS